APARYVYSLQGNSLRFTSFNRLHSRNYLQLSAIEARECGTTRVHGRVVQFLFNTQQLIVLIHALTTGWCTGLDLAGVGGNRAVRDRDVFGFTGRVRDHGGVAVALCQGNRIQSFTDGTDLVELNQQGVR